MKFLVAVLCTIAAVVAEPQGVAVHPGLATSSTYQSVQGAAGDVLLNRYNSVLGYHYIGKREAEPQVYAYAPYTYATYVRPAGVSSQYVADQFHAAAQTTIHKREAEPQGVAVHPGFATSSTYQSVQGAAGDVLLNRYNSVLGYHYIGKREAEPQVYAYAPYTYVYARPAGVSHQSISTPFHAAAQTTIHKRSAEPQYAAYAYAPAYNYAYVPAASSYQSVADQFHASAVSQIHKREAEPQGVAVHPGLATSSTYRSVQGAAGDVLLNRYNSVPLAYNYYPTAYGYVY